MKLRTALFLVLAMGCHLAYAQGPVKPEPSVKLLPPQADFFSDAVLTGTGILELYSLDKYVKLPAPVKKRLVTAVASAWRAPLLLVRSGTRTELWGWDGEGRDARLLDEWDRSPSSSAGTAVSSRRLPGFFYFGDQLSITGGTANISVNARLGCFLLDNRWDGAVTLSWKFSGDSVSMTNDLSFGLMARRRFVIGSSDFGPNIGGRLLVSYAGEEFSNSVSLVTGVSWYLGSGSLDLDLMIGSDFAVMVGYTMTPSFSRPQSSSKKR